MVLRSYRYTPFALASRRALDTSRERQPVPSSHSLTAAATPASSGSRSGSSGHQPIAAPIAVLLRCRRRGDGRRASCRAGCRLRQSRTGIPPTPRCRRRREPAWDGEPSSYVPFEQPLNARAALALRAIAAGRRRKLLLLTAYENGSADSIPRWTPKAHAIKFCRGGSRMSNGRATRVPGLMALASLFVLVAVSGLPALGEPSGPHARCGSCHGARSSGQGTGEADTGRPRRSLPRLPRHRVGGDGHLGRVGSAMRSSPAHIAPAGTTPDTLSSRLAATDTGGLPRLPRGASQRRSRPAARRVVQERAGCGEKMALDPVSRTCAACHPAHADTLGAGAVTAVTRSGSRSKPDTARRFGTPASRSATLAGLRIRMTTSSDARRALVPSHARHVPTAMGGRSGPRGLWKLSPKIYGVGDRPVNIAANRSPE